MFNATYSPFEGGQNRVTRLGEFLPIGRLFSLGSVFQITKVAQIKVMYLF
jgi:hypothetical protein